MVAMWKLFTVYRIDGLKRSIKILVYTRHRSANQPSKTIRAEIAGFTIRGNRGNNVLIFLL